MAAAVVARTYQEALAFARAAGQDAGNRNMRRAGRIAWSDEDWNVAADTCHRAMKALGFDPESQPRDAA